MKFTFAPETRPLTGYTIKRAIHRGGFGEVYYALSDAGKEVALKLLNNNLEVELRGVSQCLNLKHPNLVTLFDIRQDEDRDYWIVMEFVSGRGLYEVLKDHASGLPLAEVLSWLSGISAGLSFLHDRGIVHRDLKPANVFYESGIVKIGDVGLSKYISESRRSAQTQSVGTVYYMAPEVARGRYGREVDVYALGVMLVEMLTGHVPFDGETTAEILMKHMTADPDLSGVPERLHAVLKQALEKDPAARIGDVEELERRFRAAAADTAVSGNVATPDRTLNSVSLEHVSPEHVSSRTPEIGPSHGASPRPPLRNLPQADRLSPPAVTMNLQGLVGFWNDRVPTGIKWCVAGFALLTLTRILPSREATLLWFAAIYFAGRELLKPRHPRSSQSVVPGSAATPVRPVPGSDLPQTTQHAVTSVPTQPAVAQPVVAQSRNYSPATARQIPATQRIMDITSSMSMTLLAVILVTAAIHLATKQLPDLVHMVYFSAVTLLASWALIIPSKLWEGRPGDATLRRLALGMLGMGVGLAAAELKELLMLTDQSLLHVGHGGFRNGVPIGRIHVTGTDGLPTTAGFMIFFGVLFACRRWWWQIDSFRKSRLRVSSAVLTLLMGSVLSAALPFPGILGMTWALATSAVVQLCAGWTPHEDRRLVAAPGVTIPAPIVTDVRHPVVPPRTEIKAAPAGRV